MAALAVAFLLIVVAPHPAEAQTFTVLHNFTGGADGQNPYAGLTLDGAGNLYGTTYRGAAGYGGVYKLEHRGSGWTLDPLYSFTSSPDGANPLGRVVFGPNGTLYGMTEEGGAGDGTVFNLRPFPSVCKTALCPWMETQLFVFPANGEGGDIPVFGDILFDQSGNIYGTTSAGGANGAGLVFELTPSGGSWTESILYTFSGGRDGENPFSGLIFDGAGNLYGTTAAGGLYGYGTVFKLTYQAGTGWTQSTLYTFSAENDGGGGPEGALVFDQSGNLYGTTLGGGANGSGTVFELTPTNGSWILNTLFSFPKAKVPPCGPTSALAWDTVGNLYGTTSCGGTIGFGNVFELSPSNGGWTYTNLHTFTGGTDGGYTWSNVSFDNSGNLYGTTVYGGTGSCSNGPGGCGVVWEITPD